MVISPLSMPKASSSTFTIGTKQLVVHDALDTTKSFAGSNSSSLTPTTKVASTSLAGAEMIDPGGTGLEVGGGRPPGGEQPGRLDDHVDPERSHGRAFGSRSASTAIGAGVDHDRRFGDLDLAVEAPVGRVVAEQMGEGLRRGEIVDGHHLDVGAHRPGRSQIVAADAAEAVDADPYGHAVYALPFLNRRAPRCTVPGVSPLDERRPVPR